MAQIPVPKGISAYAVTNIPDKWDKQWFRYFIGNFLAGADIRNATAGPGITISGNVSADSTPPSFSGSTVVITQAPIANNTVLGNVSGGAAVPVGLSQAQLTSLVNVFTASLSGVVPASGGGVTTFLRADGTFAVPPGGNPIPNNTVLGNVSGSSAVPGAINTTQLTTLVNPFTSLLSGAVPASGGGTTTFLRADGTFQVPPVSSGANPSALVGLSAVNGVATTFMRSDAAPALDQGISPTWTGAHNFSIRLLANAGLGVSGGTFTSRGIADNGTANALTIAVSGAVTISTPTSGNTAFTVGVTNAIGAVINSGWPSSTGAADVQISRAGSQANNVGRGPTINLVDSTNTTATFLQHSGGQFELWMTQNNGATWNRAFRVTTGNTLIVDSPPASATSLQVNCTPSGSSPNVFVSGTGSGAGPIYSVVQNNTSTGYSSFRLYNDQNIGTRALEIDYAGSAFAGAVITSGPSGEQGVISTTGLFPLTLGTNNVARITIAAGGNTTILAALGVNGNTPPAQVTGWGAPTGAGVIANFPGATATLAQCSQVIARLISDLKSFGLYGA